MKNPLQNLLIFFALCLCALIAFQWHREARLRQDLQKLTDTVQDKLESIRGLERGLKDREEEVKRLDTLKTELTATVKSNRLQLEQLSKDLAKSNAEVERSTKQLETYKAALDQANERIKKQNEEVLKQNEDLKTLQKLADERNDAIMKYNDVVLKFNDLAKKWEALQGAATNGPAKK